MEDTYLLTMRCPVYRRRDSHSGSRTELETLIGDVKGKRTSGDPTRPKVPMRRSGSDHPILVMKWGNAHGAKGAGHSRRDRWVNRKLEEPTVSTEDGSLQWVARAGYVERPKSGSVRGSGCNSPDLLGKLRTPLLRLAWRSPLRSSAASKGPNRPFGQSIGGTSRQ